MAGGNVFVTGSFLGTVDSDPGPGTYALKASYQENGFVLKLTSGGGFVWASAFLPLSSGGNCYPAGIAVDSSGYVYASGGFTGSVDFDPAPNQGNQGKLVLDGGSGSGFVTKLNASGNLVWAKKLANGYEGSGGSVAVDAAGAVYLTGGFTGTVDFDPGVDVFNLTSTGGTDIFVMKLDTNGAFQWAVSAGGAADDYGYGLCVDGFGDIYVTGSIGSGTADFDPSNTYVDNRDLVTTATATGFLWQLRQS